MYFFFFNATATTEIYTLSLHDALPIPGTPPSLIHVPSGCPFHPRCAYAAQTNGRSVNEVPQLRAVGPGHEVACHLSTDEQRRIWGEQAARMRLSPPARHFDQEDA